MSRGQTEVDIQRLQSELARLQEEEQALQNIVSLVKSQLSAVQVLPWWTVLWSRLYNKYVNRHRCREKYDWLSRLQTKKV